MSCRWSPCQLSALRWQSELFLLLQAAGWIGFFWWETIWGERVISGKNLGRIRSADRRKCPWRVCDKTLQSAVSTAQARSNLCDVQAPRALWSSALLTALLACVGWLSVSAPGWLKGWADVLRSGGQGELLRIAGRTFVAYRKQLTPSLLPGCGRWRMCVCVGVWVCGCVGVWVCVCVCVCVPPLPVSSGGNPELTDSGRACTDATGAREGAGSREVAAWDVLGARALRGGLQAGLPVAGTPPGREEGCVA